MNVLSGARRTGSALLSFAFSAVLVVAAPAIVRAQTVTIVSNMTDWLQSTDIDTTTSNDSSWGGPAFLPAISTYTLIPTTGSAANPIAGTTNLHADNDVEFFRTTFLLPAFTSLSMELQTYVDNDSYIYFNGHLLAGTSILSFDNFGAATPLSLTRNPDGSVTNGPGTNGPGNTDSFDNIALTFPDGFFNVGANELVVAVRNTSGDQGGFTFRSDFTLNAPATAAPEPGSLALLASGAFSVAAIAVRRRRRA